MSERDEGSVRVICRFRPQNQKEVDNRGEFVARFDRQAKTVYLETGKDTPHRFIFDDILSEESTQQQVYEQAAFPVVQAVLQGYNGTIFAYGQTSSGKTHTMEGKMDDPELMGIAPRTVNSLFEGVASAPEHIEFSVKVSHMELYMEKIHDLLDPSRNNLQVREEKTRGIWVAGLTEHYVSSGSDIITWMKYGLKNRAKAATGMNADSSRSHSLLAITVEQKNLNDLRVKVGKLFLVDLAGSEKISKSLVEGIHLDEVRAINTSLHVLGKVIHALTEPKISYIPYRDSKLTRILQESLGGNAKTTLIICCSPSSYNTAETMSTLRFGERAKSIKNKPKVNEEKSVAELKLMISEKDKEILKLKGIITGLRDEISLLKQGGVPSNVAESEGKALDSNSEQAVADQQLDTGRLEQLQFLQDALIQLELKYTDMETERNDLKVLVDRLVEEIATRDAASQEQNEYIEVLEEKVGELCGDLEIARWRPSTTESEIQAEQEIIPVFEMEAQTDPVSIPQSTIDVQTVPIYSFLKSTHSQSDHPTVRDFDVQAKPSTSDAQIEIRPHLKEFGVHVESIKEKPPHADMEMNTDYILPIVGNEDLAFVSPNTVDMHENSTSEIIPHEGNQEPAVLTSLESKPLNMAVLDSYDMVYVTVEQKAQIREFFMNKLQCVTFQDACVGADFTFAEEDDELQDEEQEYDDALSEGNNLQLPDVEIESDTKDGSQATEVTASTQSPSLSDKSPHTTLLSSEDAFAETTPVTESESHQDDRDVEHIVSQIRRISASQAHAPAHISTAFENSPTFRGLTKSPGSFLGNDFSLQMTPRGTSSRRMIITSTVETQTPAPRSPVLSTFQSMFSLAPVEKTFAPHETQTINSYFHLAQSSAQTEDGSLQDPVVCDVGVETVKVQTVAQASEVDTSITNPTANEDTQVTPALMGLTKDAELQTLPKQSSVTSIQTDSKILINSTCQSSKTESKDAEVECYLENTRKRWSTYSPKAMHASPSVDSIHSNQSDNSGQKQPLMHLKPDEVEAEGAEWYSDHEQDADVVADKEHGTSLFDDEEEEPLTSPEELGKRLDNLERDVEELTFEPAKHDIKQIMEIITSPAVVEALGNSNDEQLRALRDHALSLQKNLDSLAESHDQISRAYRNIHLDYNIRLGILQRRDEKIRELEDKLKKDQIILQQEKVAHDRAMRAKQRELAAAEEQLRLIKLMMVSNSQVYSTVSTNRAMKTVVPRGQATLPPQSPQNPSTPGTSTPNRKQSIFARLWGNDDHPSPSPDKTSKGASKPDKESKTPSKK